MKHLNKIYNILRLKIVFLQRLNKIVLGPELLSTTAINRQLNTILNMGIISAFDSIKLSGECCFDYVTLLKFELKFLCCDLLRYTVCEACPPLKSNH